MSDTNNTLDTPNIPEPDTDSTLTGKSKKMVVAAIVASLALVAIGGSAYYIASRKGIDPTPGSNKAEDGRKKMLDFIPSDIPEDDQKFLEAEMEDGHNESETENVEDDAEEAVNELKAQKQTLPPQPPPTPSSTPNATDSDEDLQESADTLEYSDAIINPEILDLAKKLQALNVHQETDIDSSEDEIPDLIPLEDAEPTSRVDENDLSADEQETTPSDDTSLLETVKSIGTSLCSNVSSFISDRMSVFGRKGTAVIEDQDQVAASSELADDSRLPKDTDASADESEKEEAIAATHDNNAQEAEEIVYPLFEDPPIHYSSPFFTTDYQNPLDASANMTYFDLSDMGKGEYLLHDPDVSESLTGSVESTVEDEDIDQNNQETLDADEDEGPEEIQKDTEDDKQKDPDAIEEISSNTVVKEVIEDLIEAATSDVNSSENDVHEEQVDEAPPIPKEEKSKPEVIQVGDDSISYLKPDKDTILLGYNLTDPSSFGDHLLQLDYSFIKPHEEMVATYNGQRYICTMKMSQEVDPDLLMMLKNGAIHLIENPENKLKRKFGKIATESYVPNNLLLAISRKPFDKDTTLVQVDSFASGGKLYNTAVHHIYHVFAKDQDAYHFQILTDPSAIPDADEFRSPDEWLKDGNIVVNKSGYKVIIRSPVELKDDFVSKLTDKVIDIVKPKTGELESTKNDEWAEFLMEKVGWYGYNYLNFGILPSVRILVVPNP